MRSVQNTVFIFWTQGDFCTESANLAPTLHAINYNVGIGACFIGASLVFALISWIFTCSGNTVLKNVQASYTCLHMNLSINHPMYLQ